ncbi:unnamed protein product [Polarella glacialis]|uniref:Chlorophyllase n=1 Tax=Polarella glacialis TaxID=89957 RepID=A0A813LI36_POLGL|nr:unnamed protein product [Polarella glacialis]
MGFVSAPLLLVSSSLLLREWRFQAISSCRSKSSCGGSHFRQGGEGPLQGRTRRTCSSALRRHTAAAAALIGLIWGFCPGRHRRAIANAADSVDLGGTSTGSKQYDEDKTPRLLYFKERLNFKDLRLTLTFPARKLEVNELLPLAVFTGGFATEASEYTQLAESMASGGCAVLRYDVPASNSANDDTLVASLRSLLDFVESDPMLQRIFVTNRVLLVGHSRGGKLSSLVAGVDERVAGVCLLDPVDNTIWAPLGPGFPSATDALRSLPFLRPQRQVPVAIVGAGTGGDCAPAMSNYHQFFAAAPSPAWLVVIPAAGHAQFMDRDGLGLIERAICGDGGAPDDTVQATAVTVCLAWAELIFGPLQPDNDRSRSLEVAAARVEVNSSTRLTSVAAAGGWAEMMSVAVGTTARVTADRLLQQGLEIESFVKL